METVTSTTLLEAIRNGKDNLAWGRFTTRYRPMIISFAVRLGLTTTDSEDIAQETLITFFRCFQDGQLDRQRGRLRNWLFTIAQCKVRESERQMKKEPVYIDDANADEVFEIECPNRLEAVWNQEWHRSVINACLAEISKDVSPQTMEIFTLYVLKEWTPEKIARHLGITISTVYLAKNRVMKRFREIKETMEEIW